MTSVQGEATASTERSPLLTAQAPEWFEVYFRCHYADLVRVALYAGALDRHEANDAISEVVTRQLTRGAWDNIGHPRAYFARAVARQVLAFRRRQPASRVVELAPEVADRCGAPDLNMNIWEDEEWVDQLLQSLPPSQYKVMRHVIDGLDTHEMAELLGKSEATVRSNLRHARARLQKLVPPQRAGARSEREIASQEGSRND